MIKILNRIEHLTDADLYLLCEAIDLELQARENGVGIVFHSAPVAGLPSGRSATAAATEPRPRRSTRYRQGSPGRVTCRNA